LAPVTIATRPVWTGASASVHFAADIEMTLSLKTTRILLCFWLFHTVLSESTLLQGEGPPRALAASHGVASTTNPATAR
jgi:hypothetical protein